MIEVDSYKNGRVLVTIHSWNGIGLWVSMFGAWRISQDEPLLVLCLGKVTCRKLQRHDNVSNGSPDLANLTSNKCLVVNDLLRSPLER